MDFVIDTGEGDMPLPGATLPRTVYKIMEYLDSLPPGKLVTCRKIASAIGLLDGTVQNNTKNPALKPYRAEVGYNKIYWGNPATIEAFRKEIGGDGAKR
jgi:hypothetical protein